VNVKVNYFLSHVATCGISGILRKTTHKFCEFIDDGASVVLLSRLNIPTSFLSFYIFASFFGEVGLQFVLKKIILFEFLLVIFKARKLFQRAFILKYYAITTYTHILFECVSKWQKYWKLQKVR
jgi:hypothetical protein